MIAPRVRGASERPLIEKTRYREASAGTSGKPIVSPWETSVPGLEVAYVSERVQLPPGPRAKYPRSSLLQFQPRQQPVQKMRADPTRSVFDQRHVGCRQASAAR